MLYEAKVMSSFAAVKPPNFFKFLRNHSHFVLPPASSSHANGRVHKLSYSQKSSCLSFKNKDIVDCFQACLQNCKKQILLRYVSLPIHMKQLCLSIHMKQLCLSIHMKQLCLSIHMIQICLSIHMIQLCLSIHMIQLSSKWTHFHEIWYLIIFLKYVEKSHFSLISNKNNGYFTWRPTYVYGNILLNSF